MNKRQAQLQKMLEEFLLDNLDELLKDSRRSIDSLIDKYADRDKLESLGRDALESLDRDKIEKWAREVVRSVEPDKLEHWVRNTLRSQDAGKLKRLLRDKLGGLDKNKLESLLAEGMHHFDRRKLESRLRDRIRSLDLDKIKGAAQSGLAAIDTQKIDELVRTRLDDVVDDVVRERVGQLTPDELKAMLKTKSAELKKQARKSKEKLASATKGSRVSVEVEDNKRSNPITGFVGTMGRFAALGAAGWIAYSHLLLEHQVPLPKAIAAELLTLAFRSAGPISAYHDRQGNGRPLVLIHSVNAAASAYEMRPLFQHYRGQRPVYALDLPGFGFSARPKVEYKPETYVEAILTLLDNIGNGPVDVVALSLGSEFAAEAARRRPNLFNSLAVISPTGMYERDSARSSQAASNQGFDNWLYPLLSMRLWARPFYDLLTTHRSIQYFLQKSFVGPIPDGMVDYAYATSHQPGAENAPLYFVSGKLFTPNALDRIYRHVKTPSLVIYDRDGFVRFDRLPELLAANDAWHEARVSPSLGMPQWERLEDTVAALEKFWQSHDEEKTSDEAQNATAQS
jgi:pimeloyl-ACP methyl ester carboxylesterase